MSPKVILALCAQVFLVQSALSQCTSRAEVVASPGIAVPALTGPYGLPAPGLAAPYGLNAPGLASPYDIVTPGSASPYGLYAPGLASPYDLVAPGLASPYGLYAPGLASPYDLVAPGLASPYGLPAPGLAAPYGLAAPGLIASYGLAAPGLEFSPTSGGLLPVSSASDFAPVGISVHSQNAYGGFLESAGELPFIGSVGFEGVLPTAGAGAVNHACGNGINAMASDNIAFSPAYGYRAGWK